MEEELNFQQNLRKFEEMLKFGRTSFFDVDDFEELIDYYLDIRNFRYAEKACAKALSQHPGAYGIRIKQVHIYLEAGNPARAMESLALFADFEKEDYEYGFLKGTALVQLGSFLQAEQLFDEVLRNEIEDKDDILFNISIAFENAGQFELAVKYLIQAYEIDPGNVNVLYDLGFYYEKLEKYHEALNFYDQYLNIDAFSENVWYNMGVIHYKCNEYEKALQCYDYAIAINPSYGSAYFNKANLYANQDNYLMAIKVYNDFLELEPDNLEGWCYLGECFEETGNYTRSLEIYRKVIEIDNTYAEGWFGAGISLLNLERVKEAASYVLKAIDFDRENSEFWFMLGEINEKMHNSLEALKCYRYVCKLDPVDREAWIRLTKLFVSGNQWADALVALREAYQNNPGSQDIIYLLSAVYFRLGDEDSGTRFFQKAISMGEGGAKLFFEIYPEGKSNQKIKTLLYKN